MALCQGCPKLGPSPSFPFLPVFKILAPIANKRSERDQTSLVNRLMASFLTKNVVEDPFFGTQRFFLNKIAV